MVQRIAYKKVNNVWTNSYVETDPENVYKWLANDLIAKKINQCKYITKITRRNNYDGTQTITVYYDSDVKADYIVKI